MARRLDQRPRRKRKERGCFSCIPNKPLNPVGRSSPNDENLQQSPLMTGFVSLGLDWNKSHNNGGPLSVVGRMISYTTGGREQYIESYTSIGSAPYRRYSGAISVSLDEHEIDYIGGRWNWVHERSSSS